MVTLAAAPTKTDSAAASSCSESCLGRALLTNSWEQHLQAPLIPRLSPKLLKVNFFPQGKALTFGEQHFLTASPCCRSQNSPQVSWISDIVADEE